MRLRHTLASELTSPGAVYRRACRTVSSCPMSALGVFDGGRTVRTSRPGRGAARRAVRARYAMHFLHRGRRALLRAHAHDQREGDERGHGHSDAREPVAPVQRPADLHTRVCVHE